MIKIEKVLEKLTTLLESWGISRKDWLFTAQYADRLLGYDVTVREGHLNILVKRGRIPWKIIESLEVHPPLGTSYDKSYQKFIAETDFEFDLITLSNKECLQRLKHKVSFKLPSGQTIQVINPWGELDELDKIFSKSTPEGWGEEKGFRVYPYLEVVRKAALKKGEAKLARAYERLAQKYKKFAKTPKRQLDFQEKLIKGLAVSKGKIKGNATIVIDPEKAATFTKGNILITAMTSPKFTVILNKASAIVTDEGGMLCHAAIVAREMGIPCIVGTKIATKAFKTGEKVFVNANEGYIKRLK